MSTTVSQAFAALRDTIKLDPAEYQRAIAVHNAVTAYLKDAGLITGAFLQGSLARKTMIAPLRDVDKVVLLAVDYTKIPNGQQIAAEKIAAALKAMYPALEPEIGKHCVMLDFGETTFSFDIVPAVDRGDDRSTPTKTRRRPRVASSPRKPAIDYRGRTSPRPD